MLSCCKVNLNEEEIFRDFDKKIKRIERNSKIRIPNPRKNVDSQQDPNWGITAWESRIHRKSYSRGSATSSQRREKRTSNSSQGRNWSQGIGQSDAQRAINRLSSIRAPPNATTPDFDKQKTLNMAPIADHIKIDNLKYADQIKSNEEHTAYRKMMLERLKTVSLTEDEYEDYIRYKKEALQIHIPDERLRALMIVINKGDFLENFGMSLEEYEIYEEKYDLIDAKKLLIYSKPNTSSIYYHMEDPRSVKKKLEMPQPKHKIDEARIWTANNDGKADFNQRDSRRDKSTRRPPRPVNLEFEPTHDIKTPKNITPVTSPRAYLNKSALPAGYLSPYQVSAKAVSASYMSSRSHQRHNGQISDKRSPSPSQRLFTSDIRDSRRVSHRKMSSRIESTGHKSFDSQTKRLNPARYSVISSSKNGSLKKNSYRKVVTTKNVVSPPIRLTSTKPKFFMSDFLNNKNTANKWKQRAGRRSSGHTLSPKIIVNRTSYRSKGAPRMNRYSYKSNYSPKNMIKRQSFGNNRLPPKQLKTRQILGKSLPPKTRVSRVSYKNHFSPKNVITRQSYRSKANQQTLKRYYPIKVSRGPSPNRITHRSNSNSTKRSQPIQINGKRYSSVPKQKKMVAVSDIPINSCRVNDLKMKYLNPYVNSPYLQNNMSTAKQIEPKFKGPLRLPPKTPNQARKTKIAQNNQFEVKNLIQGVNIETYKTTNESVRSSNKNKTLNMITNTQHNFSIRSSQFTAQNPNRAFTVSEASQRKKNNLSMMKDTMTSIKKPPSGMRRISEGGRRRPKYAGGEIFKRKKEGGDTVWDPSNYLDTLETDYDIKKSAIQKNLREDFDDSSIKSKNRKSSVKMHRISTKPIKEGDQRVNFCKLKKLDKGSLEREEIYVHKGIQATNEQILEKRDFLLEDSLDLSTTKIIDSQVLNKDSVDTALMLREQNTEFYDTGESPLPRENRPWPITDTYTPEIKTTAQETFEQIKFSEVNLNPVSFGYSKKFSPHQRDPSSPNRQSLKNNSSKNSGPQIQMHNESDDPQVFGQDQQSELFNLKNSSIKKFDEVSLGEDRSINRKTEKKSNNAEFVKLERNGLRGKKLAKKTNHNEIIENVQFTNTFKAPSDSESYVNFDPVALRQRKPNSNSSPLKFKKSPEKILEKRNLVEGMQESLMGHLNNPRSPGSPKLQEFYVKREKLNTQGGR